MTAYASPIDRETRLRRTAVGTVAWVAIVLGTALGASACDDSSDTSGSGEGSATSGSGVGSVPSGAAACAERYFSKISFECASIDCGEALLCTSDLDCLSCSDRCTAAACGSDADCADAYGHLCTDVDWRCEPYITADNLRCAVHAAGASRCGDGTCAADESCSACEEDCGYCPGAAPQMAPCTTSAECASGFCDDWCTGRCDNNYDCIGDGQGTLTGLNGMCLVASDGLAYCFPYCGAGGDCSEYPATSCQERIDGDGFPGDVCTR